MEDAPKPVELALDAERNGAAVRVSEFFSLEVPQARAERLAQHDAERRAWRNSPKRRGRSADRELRAAPLQV